MNKEIKKILDEMEEICNVWVKVDGTMKSYTQDQIHCIYEYITDLQERINLTKTFLVILIKLQENNEVVDSLREALRLLQEGSDKE